MVAIVSRLVQLMASCQRGSDALEEERWKSTALSIVEVLAFVSALVIIFNVGARCCFGEFIGILHGLLNLAFVTVFYRHDDGVLLGFA